MSDVEVGAEPPSKRGRGRPKKSLADNGIDAVKNGTDGTRSPQKRGRKPGSTKASGEAKSRRGRGRPKKTAAQKKAAVKKASSGKPRGRPRKTDSTQDEAPPIDESGSASASNEDED